MNDREQIHPLVERKEPTHTVADAARPSLIRAANESSPFSSEPSGNVRHSFELHIKELALHGFDPASRYAIGEAVERELTRLLGEREALAAITRDIETEHMNGGVFELTPDSDAEAIGIELARAVYGGLRQ